MAVISQGARDLALIKASIGPWLTANWLGGGSGAEIVDVSPFGGGGVSNETLRVRFVENGLGRPLDVVLRFPPPGRGVFPVYDLAREHQVLEALSAAGLPDAAPAKFEADHRWLGESFLVMPFVSGRVPNSQPRPYVLDGWVHDLAPADQSRVLLTFTDLMADVHRVDPACMNFEPLGQQAGSPLQTWVGWWANYLEWCADGNDTAQVEEVRACLQWCVEHTPPDEPPSTFIWGDARLGNVAFGDNLCVTAAMDWECASLGPAEVDLGWQFAHRLNTAALIDLQVLPELPGFPSVEVQLDRYQERVGRRVVDLEWYTVFGAFGLATCRLAVQRSLSAAGRPGLPGDPLRPWVKKAMSDHS